LILGHYRNYNIVCIKPWSPISYVIIRYYLYDLVTQEKEVLISIGNTDPSYIQEKRRKDQIITQILTLCREGENKTMIVYQVNLNFRAVMRYLDLLMKRGFLEATQGHMVIYKTTPVGEQALEILLKADAIIS
jgi:predicted transcriptional regulator